MFLFENIIYSQTNLIQNPSFEYYQAPIDCNAGGFDNYSVSTPNHVVDNWETFYSPDYYTPLCISGYFNVPYARFGTSYPAAGSSYCGIISFVKPYEQKEYIYQNLNSPLIQDSIYCLSFFTTRADGTPYAIKTLGAYFSNSIPTMPLGYINVTPQVVNTSGFLTDTINWVEIQGCFTAQGGEQYITIGNFNSNANTDTLKAGTTNQVFGATGHAYYYIDSVSLWQNNFPTSINEFNKENTLSVYPNPAKDIITIGFRNANEKRKIAIYDAFGELVLSEDLTTKNSSLNIHQLSSGIYFYYVKQNNVVLKQDKFVIIK